MASGTHKVIVAALVGNALIAVTKFIAAAITHSSAMLSEGIHSLVDTGNQILLLYGLRQAKKPPDAQFPFGHGKEIYFWSFVVAITIFGVGAGVSIYEGIHRLQNPHPIESPHVNYIVLGLAMVFEGFAWYFAFREFRATKGRWGYIEAVQRGKDPSLFVVLFEDSAAMLGLIVAFLGVLLGEVTGNPIWDGIAALAIGFILAGTALWLAFETKGLLIGESANRRIVDGIRQLAASVPEVNQVNEVLTLHMGPDFLLVNISVEFIDSATSDRIEQAVATLTQQMKQQFPPVKRVFVEAEQATATATRRS